MSTYCHTLTEYPEAEVVAAEFALGETRYLLGRDASRAEAEAIAAYVQGSVSEPRPGRFLITAR
jgi:hypothetical protein